MLSNIYRTAAATILGLSYVSLATAQIEYYDASTSIYMTIAVPAAAAAATSGDITFNMTAPTRGWSAFGFGDQMAGSLIFVLYADGKGNVTISPRLASAEAQPSYYAGAKVTLLAGSGVIGNQNVALFTCGNCFAWDGATTLDVSSTSRSVIHSQNTGNTPNDPSSPSSTFQQHTVYGIGTIDLSKAVVAASITNPGSGSSASGGSVPSATTPPLTVATSVSTGGSSETSSPVTKRTMYIIGHGVIMSLCFLLFLPLGASFIRFFVHSWIVHAGIQLTAYVLILIALGLGVYVSHLSNSHFLYAHQRLGVSIAALLLIQAICGYMHHAYFVRHHKRSIISYGHIWLGRLLMVLGIVNGGLGLKRVDNLTNGLLVAYAVVAAVVGLVYIAGLVTTAIRGRKSNTDDGVKLEDIHPVAK